jgi:hypothetical protein
MNSAAGNLVGWCNGNVLNSLNLYLAGVRFKCQLVLQLP